MKNFFLFLLFFSCNSVEKTLVGTYKSKKSKKYDNLFEEYDYSVIGVTLKLKKDSTFIINTCGNIASGKWYVKKDSLFLKTLSNRYKIDSLNNLPEWKEQIKTENTRPFSFLIKKNELYLKEHIIRDEKSLSFTYRLVKK